MEGGSRPSVCRVSTEMGILRSYHAHATYVFVRSFGAPLGALGGASVSMFEARSAVSTIRGGGGAPLCEVAEPRRLALSEPLRAAAAVAGSVCTR